MSAVDDLERGRESFRQQAWADAFAQLTAADRETPLEPEDLERLALTAFLVGEDEASDDCWTRSHHVLLERGDVARAARCAFRMGFGLINRAEFAPAMGWFGRAQRLIDEHQLDCAERGMLLLPLAITTLDSDPPAALAMFEQAAEIGTRFGEPDLVAVARTGCGRVLLVMGKAAEGMALMDEVMVAVTSGELSPAVLGEVYCTVIEGCFEVFDMRRAQEWTSALSRWCDTQPGLVPFRGQCLVHRAEIMQMHGSWPDALDEARRACERLAKHPMLGAAYYQLAELHRLRGDFEPAEEAYRQASEWGREPQPGLALMRMAQGQLDAASAAIDRVVEAATGHLARSKLLGAYVEILLATDRVERARAAADELAAIAADYEAPFVAAVAERAIGAVLLVEGDARGALASLHRSWRTWHDLDAPREAASVRVLIGLACRALGDEDTAGMELETARRAFEQLGAAPDVARVNQLARTIAPRATDGLTAREVEVLALVATGKTNRAIAADLVLSEKTVARHISNIFTKLGLSSRSAATAYAYEHDLV
jgi:DNA-binding CsgD family transcriptional regulator